MRLANVQYLSGQVITSVMLRYFISPMAATWVTNHLVMLKIVGYAASVLVRKRQFCSSQFPFSWFLLKLLLGLYTTIALLLFLDNVMVCGESVRKKYSIMLGQFQLVDFLYIINSLQYLMNTLQMWFVTKNIVLSHLFQRYSKLNFHLMKVHV